MIQKRCSFEADVQQALKSGEWPESTQMHLQTCEICQEQARVWHSMQSLAQQTEAIAPAGTYGLIWLKARLMEKEQTRQKTIRPLLAAQTALAVLASLAAVLITHVHWPSGQSWFGDVLGSGATLLLSSGDISAIFILLFGLLFLVFSLAVTFASSTD